MKQKGRSKSGREESIKAGKEAPARKLAKEDVPSTKRGTGKHRGAPVKSPTSTVGKFLARSSSAYKETVAQQSAANRTSAGKITQGKK